MPTPGDSWHLDLIYERLGPKLMFLPKSDDVKGDERSKLASVTQKAKMQLPDWGFSTSMEKGW